MNEQHHSKNQGDRSITSYHPNMPCRLCLPLILSKISRSVGVLSTTEVIDMLASISDAQLTGTCSSGCSSLIRLVGLTSTSTGRRGIPSNLTRMGGLTERGGTIRLEEATGLYVLLDDRRRLTPGRLFEELVVMIDVLRRVKELSFSESDPAASSPSSSRSSSKRSRLRISSGLGGFPRRGFSSRS